MTQLVKLAYSVKMIDMATEDENRKRRRDREREQEDREDEELIAKKTAQAVADRSMFGRAEVSNEKLDDLIKRAEVAIDQLQSLYTMFAVGIERTPPVERRSQLDQIMLTLQMMGKPTQSALFKYSNIQARYVSYREKWDKLLKDVESGKIKRVAGPKKSAFNKKAVA